MVTFPTNSVSLSFFINKEVRVDNHFGNMILQGHCHSQINPTKLYIFQLSRMYVSSNTVCHLKIFIPLQFLSFSLFRPSAKTASVWSFSSSFPGGVHHLLPQHPPDSPTTSEFTSRCITIISQ